MLKEQLSTSELPQQDIAISDALWEVILDTSLSVQRVKEIQNLPAQCSELLPRDFHNMIYHLYRTASVSPDQLLITLQPLMQSREFHRIFSTELERENIPLRTFFDLTLVPIEMLLALGELWYRKNENNVLKEYYRQSCTLIKTINTPRHNENMERIYYTKACLLMKHIIDSQIISEDITDLITYYNVPRYDDSTSYLRRFATAIHSAHTYSDQKSVA